MDGQESKKIGASRKEAISLGLQLYFGRPCKRGHIAPRRISNNGCIECVKENLAKWKDENREYVRVRDTEYRGKTKDRRNELDRIRYNKNPEKFRLKTRVGYAKNSTKIKQKSNEYYYESYTRKEVREKAQERTRQWVLANPEKAKHNSKVANGRRRLLEKNVGGGFTIEDVREIFDLQNGRCAYCRKKVGDKYHVDHIVALSRGGTNIRSNLQITCGPCNLSKAARDPIDHARSLGMLL